MLRAVEPIGVGGRGKRIGGLAADPRLDRSDDILGSGLDQAGGFLNGGVVPHLTPGSAQLLVALPTSSGPKDITNGETEYEQELSHPSNLPRRPVPVSWLGEDRVNRVR